MVIEKNVDKIVFREQKCSSGPAATKGSFGACCCKVVEKKRLKNGKEESQKSKGSIYRRSIARLVSSRVVRSHSKVAVVVIWGREGVGG